MPDPRAVLTAVFLGLALVSTLAFAEDPGPPAATGRTAPLTAEERRRLVEALSPMWGRRTDELDVERHAGGKRIVRLDERFANVTLLSLGPDRAPRLQCVADPEAAVAWLESARDPAAEPRVAEER